MGRNSSVINAYFKHMLIYLSNVLHITTISLEMLWKALPLSDSSFGTWIACVGNVILLTNT
jgi:hypothetical protein